VALQVLNAGAIDALFVKRKRDPLIFSSLWLLC
jgi:hypothetical protein